MVECSPASKRAINEVVEILKKQGHELVEVEIPDSREIIASYLIEMAANGGKSFREILASEKEIAEYT